MTSVNVKGLAAKKDAVQLDAHVVIVKTRWNEAVINALVTGAVDKIQECGGTTEGSKCQVRTKLCMLRNE